MSSDDSGDGSVPSPSPSACAMAGGVGVLELSSGSWPMGLLLLFVAAPISPISAAPAASAIGGGSVATRVCSGTPAIPFAGCIILPVELLVASLLRFTPSALALASSLRASYLSETGGRGGAAGAVPSVEGTDGDVDGGIGVVATSSAAVAVVVNTIGPSGTLAGADSDLLGVIEFARLSFPSVAERHVISDATAAPAPSAPPATPSAPSARSLCRDGDGDTAAAAASAAALSIGLYTLKFM